MEFVGAHTNPPAGTNNTTVGIGCEGRYHTVDRAMPDVQFNALVWLLRHLRGVYGDIPIHGHRELAANACPGQFFPLDEARTLQFRGQEVEKPMERRFERVAEMPAWARPTFEMLTQTNANDGQPIVRGDQRGNLDLSLDMVRLTVILGRWIETLRK